MWLTFSLLIFSNIVMTFAWYGHLKYFPEKSLWQVILISWGIALFEYCLAVPANRWGYGKLTGFELKVLQEIITVTIFCFFAIFVLREKLTWNYFVSFLFLIGAAFFAFGFKNNS